MKNRPGRREREEASVQEPARTGNDVYPVRAGRYFIGMLLDQRAGAGGGACSIPGGGGGGTTGAGGGTAAGPPAAAGAPACASMVANSRCNGNGGEGAKYCGG